MNLGRCQLRQATTTRIATEAALSTSLFNGVLRPIWFEAIANNPDEAAYLHQLHAAQQRSRSA